MWVLKLLPDHNHSFSSDIYPVRYISVSQPLIGYKSVVVLGLIH